METSYIIEVDGSSKIGMSIMSAEKPSQQLVDDIKSELLKENKDFGGYVTVWVDKPVMVSFNEKISLDVSDANKNLATSLTLNGWSWAE